MRTFILNKTLFTVIYNDEQITIDARVNNDVYRAAIDEQSKRSYDMVCELFQNKELEVFGYSYIMLLKLPFMDNHIGLELIQ
jgi:hypothetical protein